MIVYPAIDLREGQVVQLVGGDPAQARIRLPDPVSVALHWTGLGFSALHVVDLDAALGIGSNLPAIRAILEEVDVPVQVGGGIRDAVAVRSLFEAGASRVVLGTRAVLEPDWLARQAETWPGRITLAADCRGDEVLVRGWTGSAGASIHELLPRTATLPLGALLITDVAREGRLEGTDTERFAQLVSEAPHPLIASGGITTLDELRELASAGVAGAVLGMALYTGAFDARALSGEFEH